MSGQKHQVLSEEANIHSPLWSPDGKWIVYAEHPDTIQHDSSKTFIIDAENQGSSRQVGVGFPSRWLDQTSFLTTNPKGTWIYMINGNTPKRFFRDSTEAFPVLDGQYIIYSDVIPSRTPGVWIVPASSSEQTSMEPKQLITSLGFTDYNASTKSLYYASPQNDLRRILLPGGQEEVIRGTFPNLRLATQFSIDPDGKQIVYLDAKTVRKMVMIDNFH